MEVIGLDELVDRLNGELVDVTNEIESLRKEREGVNERIRELLLTQLQLSRMVKASTRPKARSRRRG